MSKQSTYFVICLVAFSQGVINLSDLAISYLLKEDYNMNPSEMTYIQGLISIPWVIKPLWGLCTDLLPIFSYRRKSYLLIFGFMGFYLFNALSWYGSQDMVTGVGLLLSIQTCIAFCNVVAEALLVEISAGSESSTNNVSLFFGCKALGTLMTSYLSGYSLKYLSKSEIFRITSIFPLIIGASALFLKEDKQHLKSMNSYKQLQELHTFLNIPAIYKPIVFIFCFMLQPSTATAMFYFNTVYLRYGSEFLGKIKFLFALANISAVYIFKKHLKSVDFKYIFLVTTLLFSFINSIQILQVTRENVNLGIPDEAFSLCDTLLMQLVAELNMLPILVLACKICPAKIEGTMYALLMSTINLGQLLAKQIGGILMYFLHITEVEFGNLWIMILLTSVYVLLPLPFLSTIKENEMIQQKEKFSKDEQDLQWLIEKEHERLSLSYVEN